MNESLHDYVVNSLRKLNRTTDLIPIEKATGVSRFTLQKIASKTIKDSRISTLQPIHNYFKRLEGKCRAKQMRRKSA